MSPTDVDHQPIKLYLICFCCCCCCYY